MAYVERVLRAITIRSHSDARVREGRLSPRRGLAGENVIVLDPKFIRPQQTPDTLGFGRHDFGRFEPIFEQAKLRCMDVANGQ